MMGFRQSKTVFPPRKFCTEQMSVSVRMKLRNHAQAKRFKRCDMFNIKFWMLQVRENEISLRKWSGGTAWLRAI